MTNALIVGEFAPTIPRRNITALSRLPHNVAQSLVAAKLNVRERRGSSARRRTLLTL